MVRLRFILHFGVNGNACFLYRRSERLNEYPAALSTALTTTHSKNKYITNSEKVKPFSKILYRGKHHVAPSN